MTVYCIYTEAQEGNTMKERNLVAKHARQFNKAATFVDRKKAAKKGHTKHKPTHL